MANELTVSAGLRFAKGSGEQAYDAAVSKSVQVDVSGTEVSDSIQSIGTSTEALVATDVGTQGYIFLQNLDATNYCEFTVESDGTSTLIKLLAGEIAVFRASAAVYGKANTAATRIRVVVIEN
jgi:hypothetical protein